jgi:GT2 family glycosyltransferase
VRLATCNARIFGAVTGERHCVEHDQPTRGTWLSVLDRSFNVHIGSIFRRADFETVGGFDETMTHAEDLDLWVRLMALGARRIASTKCCANTACAPARPRPGAGARCAAA